MVLWLVLALVLLVVPSLCVMPRSSVGSGAGCQSGASSSVGGAGVLCDVFASAAACDGDAVPVISFRSESVNSSVVGDGDGAADVM